MTVGDDPTDAELAGRAADGDERAFADLVRRHKEPLYRLLRRYSGDPEEAYEAVQEAFISAWGALNRYDPQRPFQAWLRTIAINKARDRGRRAALRRLLFGADGGGADAVLDAPDPNPLAEEALMRRQAIAGLDRAIAGLPAALKEPLILTLFDGWSQQQAGEILGVSAKAVETRVRRAREALARALGPSPTPET